MDSRHAMVAGRGSHEGADFVMIGNVDNSGPDSNSSENAEHNQEQALTHKYFKEIAKLMPNVDEIHVTGTGQIQEQFIKYLSETPQYKNTEASESTSNKMGHEDFISFVDSHFK